MKTRLLTLACILVISASNARADWAVYNNFAAYNAAVGGNHSLFLNFDQDKFGNSLLGQSGTINGNVFSNDVTYSTPSQGSPLVNYADIGNSINVEIGPVGSWDGILRAQFNETYYATGFTVIEGETTTQVSFFNGANLLNTINLTTTGTFQFFGVVTDQLFDRYEINGIFYAIDANYASAAAVPVPAGFVLAGIGMVGVAGVHLRRKRKAKA